MMDESKYPNCVQLNKHANVMAEIRGFLEFISAEHGILLLPESKDPDSDFLVDMHAIPLHESKITDLMYLYFGINPIDLERERNHMLRSLTTGQP